MNQKRAIGEEHRTITKGNRFPVRVGLRLALSGDKPIIKRKIIMDNLQCKTKNAKTLLNYSKKEMIS